MAGGALAATHLERERLRRLHFRHGACALKVSAKTLEVSKMALAENNVCVCASPKVFLQG